jgi:hypothetical protein
MDPNNAIAISNARENFATTFFMFPALIEEPLSIQDLVDEQ